MIEPPVNDGACLAQLVAVARRMRSEPMAYELASRVATVAGLVDTIRALPQRDDDGRSPGVACDVWQRLREWPADPNCFERTAMFLAVADLVEPGSRWSAATFDTAAGRHTAPLRLYSDGSSEVFNLTPLRNARLMVGFHGVRNAADPWVQEVFGVTHTVGTVVLSAYGLAPAAKALGDEQRRAGLLKEEPAQKTQPAVATGTAKGKEGSKWRRTTSRTARKGGTSRGGLGLSARRR